VLARIDLRVLCPRSVRPQLRHLRTSREYAVTCGYGLPLGGTFFLSEAALERNDFRGQPRVLFSQLHDKCDKRLGRSALTVPLRPCRETIRLRIRLFKSLCSTPHTADMITPVSHGPLITPTLRDPGSLINYFSYKFDLVTLLAAVWLRIPIWIRMETQDEAFERGRVKEFVR